MNEMKSLTLNGTKYDSFYCANAVSVGEQTLTEEQKAQARENIGVSADVPYFAMDSFKNAFKAILASAVYTSDQSDNIMVLTGLMDNADAKWYGITSKLVFVIIDNNDSIVAENATYVANLSTPDNYVIDTVTVTMGGVDVTETVYDNNHKITIPVVTGDVVITASAIYVGVEDTIVLNISTGFLATKGLVVYPNKGQRAGVAPVGQYLTKDITYKFSLGGASANYNYGVQIMQASAPGLTFVDSPVTKETYFDVVTACLWDPGWTSNDRTYTVNGENVIMCCSLKTVSGDNLTEEDIAILNENFTIEVV